VLRPPAPLWPPPVPSTVRRRGRARLHGRCPWLAGGRPPSQDLHRRRSGAALGPPSPRHGSSWLAMAARGGLGLGLSMIRADGGGCSSAMETRPWSSVTAHPCSTMAARGGLELGLSMIRADGGGCSSAMETRPWSSATAHPWSTMAAACSFEAIEENLPNAMQMQCLLEMWTVRDDMHTLFMFGIV
jgi:hypothetical protein